MNTIAPSAPSPAAAWLLAIRPKTLTAGLVPVVVGTGLAFGQGLGSLSRALAALAGALCIQIGTNLINDHADFVRGADTEERLGPARATQSGWLSADAVVRGAKLSFAGAFLIGLYLVAVAGWPVVVIGLASLLCGWAYTGGPYPLGYHGLGDLLVLLFFGFVAVGGTYYVQAGTLAPEALWAGLAVGCLGTALIVVNNVRDRETDARVGKRTLSVRLGPLWSRIEYFVVLAVAFLVPVGLFVFHPRSPWLLVPLTSLPLVLSPARRVWRERGRALNAALGETARLQLAFGLLLGFALWRGIR